MRTLVESLKRLYKIGKVSDQRLKDMVADGKITEEEYKYIIG